MAKTAVRTILIRPEETAQALSTSLRTLARWRAADLVRTTGAGIGEVCAALWENIDWDVGRITYEDTVVFEERRNQLRGT